MRLRIQSLLPVVFVLCLVACAAKRAPNQIEVIAPAQFSGAIVIQPCTSTASAVVTLRADGTGETSICPPGDVQLLISRGSQSQSQQMPVQVERTGDGIPVAIKAAIH